MSTTLEVTNTWNHWSQMFQASYSRTSRGYRIWRSIVTAVFIAICLYLLYSMDVFWLQVALGLLVVNRLFHGRTMALLCYLSTRWVSGLPVILEMDYDERGLRIRMREAPDVKEISWSDCENLNETEEAFLFEMRAESKSRIPQRVPFIIPKDSFRDEEQLAEFRTLAGSLINSRVAE